MREASTLNMGYSFWFDENHCHLICPFLIILLPVGQGYDEAFSLSFSDGDEFSKRGI